MLTCCVCAGAWAQGTLNVPEVNRKAGTVRQAIIVKKSASREGVVKIQLDGSANYRDMRFDLTLPDGISLVTEPTTENPVVKVDAKEGQNHVLFYALNEQTVKIAVVDKPSLSVLSVWDLSLGALVTSALEAVTTPVMSVSRTIIL